jgi:large subunit ribosomal protein L10
MKTRETKQQDLAAITESLANSKSAMVVSFTKLTVQKDQEFRNSLRDAGAEYQVVKNTLARIAVKGTQFEQATDAFKGVTAIAWTENDPVILSKAISKFMKDNAETYTFKTGVVEGRLVDLTQLNTIASLPSKEELISKLLFVLNAQAQRIVTVINAVPRDLAVVIKQIGEQEGRAAGAPKAEAAPAENEGADDAAASEIAAEVPSSEGADDAAAAEVAAPETAATETGSESAANAPDDAAQAEVEGAPAPEESAAE